MPFQPGIADVHVDGLLTGLSIAYIQEEKDFVASQMGRAIPVRKQSDIIPRYAKNDFFRDEAQKRAPASETAGSGYTVDTTMKYFAEEYGFHKDIPVEIRNNQDSPFNTDNDSRIYVTQKLLVKGDVLLAEAVFKSGVWASDVTPVDLWDDYGLSVPIIDIEAGKDAIHKVTSYDPNRLLMGREVWTQLKHHPLLLERFKYTQAGIITRELVSRVVEVDIVVAQSIRATNVEGATGAYSYNFGKNALLAFVNPRPSLLTPSAYYSFRWINEFGREITIRRLVNKWKRFERIEGFFNIDHKVISTDLGYFFNNVVG